MLNSESELIEQFFRGLGATRSDVTLGIGDDAALLSMDGGSELVLTTDALVEGVHFLPGAPPHSLGHRALAVNLSDIAAMGATPRWALLALNLPQADERWLQPFADGFGALARVHNVALVGGNVTRGPLSITVQLAGAVTRGQALRRDGAHPGDGLYVSGYVGDAAAGLAVLRDGLQVDTEAADYLRRRFEYPTPRVELGQELRSLASACIDISDGLYLDAQRLLAASGCSARVEITRLPLSPAMRVALGERAWRFALDGGEDYELCFTVSPDREPVLAELAERIGTPLTCIGRIRAGCGIELERNNSVMQFSPLGFDHFRG